MSRSRILEEVDEIIKLVRASNIDQNVYLKIRESLATIRREAERAGRAAEEQRAYAASLSQKLSQEEHRYNELSYKHDASKCWDCGRTLPCGGHY